MNGYKAYAQVLDWGGHVTKMVVRMPETVSALDPADFTVHVQKIDPETGMVAMTPKSFFSKTMRPAVGELAIREAYPCDGDGNEAASGEYAALIPYYGPQYPYSGLNFQKRGYTTFSDPRYTVCWKGQVVANRGEVTLEGRELVETGVAASGLKYAWVKPQIENEKPPVVIWLHGAGEGGWDPYIAVLGNKVINIAFPKIQGYFGGAYLFAPQCPTMWMDDGSGEYHREGKSMYVGKLKAAIDEFLDAHPEIDRDRVYIGGCSNGGFMTMDLLIRAPELFAAAAPCCEAFLDDGITDEMLQRIRDIPLWLVWAENDRIVPPERYALPTWRRLSALGAPELRRTVLKRVTDPTGLYCTPEGAPCEYNGHFSWVPFLDGVCRDAAGEDLWHWLAVQRRR